MTEKTLKWIKKVQKEFKLKHKEVLEVGSLDVNGNPRELFKEAGYLGIDIKGGKGVDTIHDARAVHYRYGQESFDAVLCFNVLEHIPDFWQALRSMGRVLEKGGYFYISVPHIGHSEHDYPSDYYRFTEAAVREVIMEGYDVLDLEIVDTKPGRNFIVNCLGRKKK